MPIYAVTYTYTDDSAARGELHPAHREFLGTLVEQGINLVSGPFVAGEAPGALLLFRAADKQAALAATDKDPFRVQGLVRDVSVQEWKPVLGPLADQLS
ncbi:YciI family protein [Streptomyces sp. NBC_01003]|uniref:YciI family protein n=1 Tax=Streptomyces sp. NBC_01003 TaxID=2903714 RepID=UPI00386EE5EB|nr:YciI family protein [Streptomyces sp. NBC_01003]